MMSALMESDKTSSLFLGHVLCLAFIPVLLTVSVDYVACEVRLVGGSDTIPNAGRVEVWNTDSSEWIPVCASYWDFRDGQVVCRELGYPGTLSVNYYYRNVKMSDTVGGYQCYGTEKSLSRCRRSPATLCLGLHAGVKCSAPGYLGCFYVYNPSGYSPVFWTYEAYSDWSVGTCVQESRRRFGRDSDFPQFMGMRQSVCWYSLRLSRFEGRRRSDAMCDLNCVETAEEECGGSKTIAVYDVTRGYCKDPGNVTNGTREIHHAADDFYFGTVISFWCDIGFELLGTATIQCVVDSGPLDVSWNSSLPTCSKFRPTVYTTTVLVNDETSNGPESTQVSPMVTNVTVPDIHVSQRVANATVTALEAQVSPGITIANVSETHVTPMIHNVNVTTQRVSYQNVTTTETHVSPRITDVTVPENQVTPEVNNVTVTAPGTNVYPGVSNLTAAAPETHVSTRVTNVTMPETQVTTRIPDVTVPERQVTKEVANVTVTATGTNVYPRVSNLTAAAPETHMTPTVAHVPVTERETYKVYPSVPIINVNASETSFSPRVTNDTVTVPGTQVSHGVPVLTVTTPVPEIKGTHEPIPEDRQNCWLNLGLIIVIVAGIAICILLNATMLTICFFHIRGRRVKSYSFLTIDKTRRPENGLRHLDDSRAPASLARYSSARRGRRPSASGESNNNGTSHDVIMMQCCNSEWVENETYESVGPPSEGT